MRIYLDHNATTPLRPEAAEAMARAARETWGNPSSVHAEGAAARAAVERAREQVAGLVGARPEQVVFTSGATEANNAVLRGAVGRHLVTTTAEHPSVLAPAEALEAGGARVTRLPVDPDGVLVLEALEAVLGEQPDLVSVLWANNETGVVQPLDAVVDLIDGRLPLHVDATQMLGKLPVAGRWDYLSASAHKLGGPKGVGCLVLRRELPALLRGGPQERARRGGTENVPGIVGFGVACERAAKEREAHAARMASLRDRLWEALRGLPGARRNGDPERTLPNTLSLELPGVEADALVQALDLEGVAASAGAACHAGSVTASHVLRAMGRSDEQALACLRFSLGHGNDAAQVDAAAAAVCRLVERGG